MKRKSKLSIAAALFVLCGTAVYAQEKYSLASPDGVAFSDFKGYEDWSVVSSARTDEVLKVIVANPIMIQAYKAGIPGNGKPFPDGAKMAKIHWNAEIKDTYPGPPTVPGALHDTDFMMKDSKRFADSGGWGFAAFEYDPATDTFRPGTSTDQPPQQHDAKCGFACHTIVKSRDYVFTQYARR